MFQYYKNPNRAPLTPRTQFLSDHSTPSNQKNNKIFTVNVESNILSPKVSASNFHSNYGSFSKQQLLGHQYSPQAFTDRKQSLRNFVQEQHAMTEPNDLINLYKQEVQHMSNFQQVFPSVLNTNDNLTPAQIPYQSPKTRQSCNTQPKLRMLILDRMNKDADHAVYEYTEPALGPSTDRRLLTEMIRAKAPKKEVETQTLPIANQLQVQPPTSLPPPQIGESISNGDPVGFSRVMSIRSRKDSMNKLIMFSSHNPQEETPPNSQMSQKPFYSKSPEVPLTQHPILQANQRISKFDYKPKKPIFSPYINPMVQELNRMKEKMRLILIKKK